MSDSHLPQLPELISFASEMIKARNDFGLTQSQLSSKSGVSLSAIKAYETGRNMPGARELRELCQALQVSPNKLLFGQELPFEFRSALDVLVDSKSKDSQLATHRAGMLLTLLSSDERDSILTLIRSLAIARHGVKEVKKALLAADLIVVMTQELIQATRDGVATGTPFDVESLVLKIDESITLQGHNPDSKKLLKK